MCTCKPEADDRPVQIVRRTMKLNPARLRWKRWCLGFLGIVAVTVRADTNEFPSTAELKRLSIEELMGQEVSLVSRRESKLSEAPSAIQLISQEEIHRSGATSLPEALRLAPNLQV